MALWRKIMAEEAEVKVEDDDDVKQAREMVEMLDPLLKMPGWDYYQRMLDKQVGVRFGRKPIASKDFGAVFEKEFMSGELAGLLLAKGLPGGALAAAKELLTELIGEKDERS